MKKDTILGKRELLKLKTKVENAIAKMEATPEKWACKFEDFFSIAPEGDFSWKDQDGGDSIPVRDDDKTSGWTAFQYATEMERKEGVARITFKSYDGNDWEYDDEFTAQEATDRPIDFAVHALDEHCVYNLLKMRLYDIHCALTGEDPLDFIYPVFKRKKHVQTWDIAVSKYIGYDKIGLAFLWGRKVGTPRQLRAESLPEDVKDYCCLKEVRGRWVLDGITESDIGKQPEDKMLKGSPMKIRIRMEKTCDNSTKTANHIKRVACRRLGKEVRGLLRDMNKTTFKRG